MGGERIRERKRLLLLPACCIVLLLGMWGCPSTWYQRNPGGFLGGTKSFLGEGEGRLERAKAHFLRGEFDKALTAVQQVMETHRGGMGDEALFLMGLIYASSDNPEYDYQASLAQFETLAKEFPRSRVKEQAGLMAMLLREIISRDHELGDMKKKAASLVKALKKEKAQAVELGSEVDRLHGETERLKDQLLRLKEIDLVMEKKKNQAK